MRDRSFDIGELLIRVKTGRTALILESQPSGRKSYGSIMNPIDGGRLLYKVYEDGRSTWKHDVQIAAEYQRTAPQKRP
tara:strand:+ start:1036 stop:1269 length:234 start_codon:yes stop_codon:yes gene_type:complete